MKKPWKEWEKQIKEYCDQNDIDYDFLDRMSTSYNDESVAVLLSYTLDPDFVDDGAGLYRDREFPSKILLMVDKKQDGRLEFTQTEHTMKYAGLKND